MMVKEASGETKPIKYVNFRPGLVKIRAIPTIRYVLNEYVVTAN